MANDRRASTTGLRRWGMTAMATSFGALVACGGPPSPAQPEPSATETLASSSASATSGPPSSGNADYDKGVAALDAGDVDGARAAQKRIQDHDAKDGTGYVLLGLIDEKTGDKGGAEKAYGQAIVLRPDLEAAYVDLSALQEDAQRWADALATARSGLAKAPSSAPLHANAGIALASQGDQAGATKELDLATQNAQDPMLLVTYAHWLGTWKQSDAALAKLRAARSLAKDPGTLAAVGEEMKTLGAFSDCVPTFDQAIAAKDVPELRAYRAVCRLGAKDVAGAKDDLTKAIAAGYAPAHFWLARVLAQSGDSAGAIAEYETFLKLEPNVPAAQAARKELKAVKEHKRP